MQKYLKLVWLCLALCLACAKSASSAEYYSSIDSMLTLGSAELELQQIFREYLHAQRMEFKKYREFLKHVKEEHAIALEDGVDYLGNSLNAYKMIKRTVADWAQLHEVIKQNAALETLRQKWDELNAEIPLPDNAEVRGAVRGLSRLQKMYKLNATDLASGKINGIYYGATLSLRDCFEIAANLFDEREYALAVSWFEEVLNMLDDVKEDVVDDFDAMAEGNGPKAPAVSVEKEESEKLKVAADAESMDDGKVEDVGEDDYATYADNATVSENNENNSNKKRVENHEKQKEDDGAEYDEEVEGVNNGVDIEYDDSDYYLYVDDESLDAQSEANNTADKDDLQVASEKALHIDDEYEYNDTSSEKIQVNTLEYLILAHYRMGHTNETISYIEKLLKIEPEHKYRNMLDYVLNKDITINAYPPAAFNFYSFENYSRLCQGIQLPEKVHHKLKCRLDNQNKPVFLLAPLKIEELSLDPEITVYYDLLTDRRVEHILEESGGQFVRSMVNSERGGSVTEIRVSQQTWMKYDSEDMRAIYRIVADISGLDLSNAESMQLANYGIGGQYDPHHDYFKEGYNETQWVGNRISTSVFYLSDVKQGGYTVFPKINVYAAPVKNSMVMWYNLHKSLHPDVRTLHAGCPVIIGTKRIGNVWVHSGFQEFRRPCDLEPDNWKSFGVM